MRMRLADYMQRRKLLDRDIAAKVGVDRATVNRWRHGKGRPHLDTIQKLLVVTGGKVRAEDWFSVAQAAAE